MIKNRNRLNIDFRISKLKIDIINSKIDRIYIKELYFIFKINQFKKYQLLFIITFYKVFSFDFLLNAVLGVYGLLFSVLITSYLKQFI